MVKWGSFLLRVHRTRRTALVRYSSYCEPPAPLEICRGMAPLSKGGFHSLLLPAAAKCPVELHQALILGTARLRQH
jgi:hypothetical protein